MNTIDWPPRPTRRWRVLVFVAIGALLLGGRTLASYYIESLWFDSLGFGQVFWTTLNTQGAVFAIFAALTFAILYTWLHALNPARLAELAGGTILVNGQPVQLPVGPALRLITIGIAAAVAIIAGLGMMAQWTTLAIYWHGGGQTAADASLDPIFGRPITFYLFTLPAWRLVSGWLTTLAVIGCAASVLVYALTASTRRLTRQRTASGPTSTRMVSFGVTTVLLMFAVQVYLARFEQLYAPHQVFDGVSYTDAHIRLTGMLIVVAALIAGALLSAFNVVSGRGVRWVVASLVPGVITYVGVGLVASYVNSFIVKPNELVREAPFIAHNIAMTREAYGLHRIKQESFPAGSGIESLDPGNNEETLRNIRLWDWRALQDTLRQIQEIRTYYDFPDIDIDRYEINGTVRQVMLAARELNVERLPQSSRNWINEKLVYTHGYGITMNPVNGFTPEGLPELFLSNMPVQSTVPGLEVKRPEIYFGEVTNTDVYVRTRQAEFNYPQGEANSTTSYEGTGGIAVGGLLRRLIVGLDQGDITKLPFSDAITAESRLLMRRNIHDRVERLAPFLTLDPDPYIVLSEGRLFWMMDGFTTSSHYPYSRHTVLEGERINYLRNSVKTVVDAYDGTVKFYVFDDQDPVIARYRALFPSLFLDGSAMPATLRKHIRYPELLLGLQAEIYGLYHMTDPAVFYNREDLWSVASEISTSERREQAAAQPMEANFVLMKLPGADALEFIEILPFTPANRNNLIGWMAGRSDGAHYGDAITYHFPENRLVDGPLQIEARVDQDAQLSGQLSLWNQQGSSVRRGSLIVIPVGRALLYAQPIYLQASRSPMPELRVVVLAMQDRLAYGPTYEAALRSLLGGGAPTLAARTGGSTGPGTPQTATTAPQATGTPDLDALIADAARDLSDYQRLTSEGRLGEAGQKLEALKNKLEALQRQRR